MKSSRNPFSILAATTFVVAISSASLVHASTISWNGINSSTWATGPNWDGDSAPANDLFTDVARFALESYFNQPDAGTTSVSGIEIGDGFTPTAALTVTGTALTIGSAGITMNAEAGAATISSPLVLGAAQRWSNISASTLAINGAVTRPVGAAVNFVPTGTINLGAGSGLANTNDILGGWATVGNAGTAGSTGDFAAVDGSGNVITYAGYTDITTNMGAGSYAAQNWKNSVANVALTASATVNSLVVTQDFSVSSGATMTLGSGGLILSGISRWFKNNDAGSTAGTGQITSGLGSGELFIDSSGSGGAGDDNWRIWTKIVDNGGTAVKLVKNGPGYLRLENANTYTGGTIINTGTIFLSNNGGAAGAVGQLGTGTVTMNGGRLTLNAGTLANNFVIPTGVSAAIDNATNNATLNGNFTGGGTVTIQNTSGNNLSDSVNGSWSGFTGTLSYNTANRVVNIFAAAGMDLSNAAVNFANTGNLTNSSFRTSGTGTTKIGSLAGFGYLDVNGATEIGHLGTNTAFSGQIRLAGSITKVGGGTLTLSGANSYTGATNIDAGTLQVGDGFAGNLAAGSAVTVGAAGTLGLNLANNGTFANAITNNGVVSAINDANITVSGAIGGTGSFQKGGLGTLTLSGTSSYNGVTTVSSGGLNVTGNIATSALTLGAATLSGNGTTGAVTASDPGAIIANGNANTDTLTLGSLAFTAPGTVNLNKSGVAATAALAVTNNLNIGSGFTVNMTTSPTWTSGQTYNLISYGSLSGSTANITKGAIPGLGGRQIATIGNTGASNGNITLAISGDTPVWTGLQSGAWTTAAIGGSKNWKLLVNGGATDFVSGDVVIFNDSALGTTSVNITDDPVSVVGVSFDNSSKNYTISSPNGHGIVDGSSAATLSKSGTGTVTLATVNGYTGATTINAGTLQLGDGSANGDIATSAGIVNDGTLVFNRSVDSFTYANPITGSGAVVKSGTGTQILSGANTYSGSTTVSAGTLQLGDGGGTGSLAAAGAIINDASVVFNRFDTIAQGTGFGLISGTGSVTQAGSGTVTLSAANTYSGSTIVNAGTVVIGANNPLGTGSVTLAGGALSGSNVANYAIDNAVVAQAGPTSVLSTIGKNLDLNGNLSGSGDILRTASGAAATIFLRGDNSAFTGTFTVDFNGSAATRFVATTAGSAAGKWVINQSVDSRASLNFSDGTIQFGSLTGSGFFTNQGLGTNTVEVGALGLDETFSGVLNQGGGTLAITKVGAGTWTLTGANTYTGDTTVQAGILAVDGEAIPNANKLVINIGGKVDPMDGTEVVATLFIEGEQQAAGTYGRIGSGAEHEDDAYFTGTGTGVVSVTTGPPTGYSDWADDNAPGQTKDLDHDGDGVENGIEYFMGEMGSTFTANPAEVGGSVTWTMGDTYAGVYGTDYEVQYSTNLVSWTKANEGTVDNTVTVNPGSSVVYNMPTGGTSFVRLVVKN